MVESNNDKLIKLAEEMKGLILSREKARMEYDKNPIAVKYERIAMLNGYIYKLEMRMNSLAF
jgi:hypothetical protein